MASELCSECGRAESAVVLPGGDGVCSPCFADLRRITRGCPPCPHCKHRYGVARRDEFYFKCVMCGCGFSRETAAGDALPVLFVGSTSPRALADAAD